MFKLDVDDNWLKCCLHCHSTASDGILNPNDVVSYYISKGYRVIAITDHGKITKEHISHQSGTFLLGVEISKGESRLKENYHIVALGVDDPTLIGLKSPLDVIDEINAQGGVAVIAHPYWSGLVHEDLASLRGYIGIEVYNTDCDVEVAKGYSRVHWDALLSSGAKPWGLAVDDAHRYFVPPADGNGGWVWLEAKEETPEALLKSLREGRFYSSMGPRIASLEVSRTLVHMELTPVARVDIVSRDGKGLTLEARNLSKLVRMWKSSARRKILERRYDHVEASEEKGTTKVFMSRKNLKAETVFDKRGLRRLHVERESGFGGDYVRVEATDRYGRSVWSNPVFLNSVPTQP